MLLIFFSNSKTSASLKRTRHISWSVDEVRGDVTLIELHPVDVLDVSIGCLSFFDRDHTVFANSLQRFSQNSPIFISLLALDSTDVGDLLLDR
jgi:hypothetical protein